MQKITGNEPITQCDLKEFYNGCMGTTHYRGLTIYQELSARFMATLIKSNPDPHDLRNNAEDACNYAYALINEWNNRM